MLREYLPFWARLTEGQRRRLEEGAAVRRFARGEMVYGGGAECAGLILPTEGQLRAYMLTDEGRELTLYRLFPRDMCLFSASCVLRGIQFDVLVEAERDTTALFLPAEVYQGLMEESAAVANYTSELMADRFSEVMWRMDQILSKKLDGRLAALLVEESRLAESASLRLTHDQLARHLGSAREVVSRLLKDFQNDGPGRGGAAGPSGAGGSGIGQPTVILSRKGRAVSGILSTDRASRTARPSVRKRSAECMGLFDLFARRPALSEGLEQYRNTSGAVLLDVRTPEEYRDGHLPGAKNLPLDRLDTIAEPAGSPLFVYCRSGARSAQARARLARAGYSVTDLGGLLGYRGPLEA